MLQLNYKTYGSGDKHLIILHGFLGSLDNWQTLAMRWADAGMHVITLDMRNHGRSPHTNTHSIPEMAADVVNFMKQHQLSSACILGHSMGGKVAMHLALTNQECVSKLIVADIAPKAYRHGHDEVFAAIKSVNLAEITTRKEAEDNMKTLLGDFGTRQFILKSLERDDTNGFRWRFNVDTLFEQYENILKPITSAHPFNKPTLFLRGGLSLYIKDTDWEEIRTLFPSADLVTIERAGHWLHAEQPDVFFNNVYDFVNR